MAESILWYDLETFGTDPAYDRVAQYAAIRTTPSLEIIDNGQMLYCSPSQDYLPDPKACLLTGIGPEFCFQNGLPEHQFFRQISANMQVPQTCSAGYNSIRFDDEFIRFGLYRNLLEPYRREWENENSRWDLLDLLRAAADLRPEGINWPRDADGNRSFRLELLSQANGIEHSDAHDALADVRATIALAALLRQNQPRFFDWAYKHRTKEAVRKIIDLHKRVPFVHCSGMLSSEHGHTAVVAPIVTMPGNPNCILCYDLRFDPSELIELDPEAIRQRIFTKNEALQALGQARIHIKGVHLNRSPFVAPVRILEENDLAKSLGIDLDQCRRHWQKLQAEPLLAQKLLKVYERNQTGAAADDPDFSLYEGFISDHDRTNLDAVWYQVEISPDPAIRCREVLDLNKRLEFENRKLNEMVRRFACRNWPHSLPEAEKNRWKSFCASRLLMPPGNRLVNMDFFKRKITENMADNQLPASDKLVLKDLSDWAARLEREVLSWRPV